MSHGPTALFDKSAIQLLSKEEARWFTHFFRGVITPVFLIESLSNLAKEFPDQRDPSKMVAGLAAKVQDLGTLPNVSHVELIEMNLRGHHVEMRGVPIVGGGQRVQSAAGEWGVYFDESPEDKALHKWRVGHFVEDDRKRAAGWRATTKELDLQALVRGMNLSKEQRAHMNVATLADLKTAVDVFLRDPKAQFRTLSSALEMFDVEQRLAKKVKERWVRLGRPPFEAFAPYAAFVQRVTLTFMLGVSVQRIPQRPTNIVDLQYLYYLPFCNVFTSGDKLHRNLAPLFMGGQQKFIWALDLKVALAAFVEYYAKHEEELRRRGSMDFARYPPLEIETVIHEVYDRLRPRWRQDALVPEEPMTPERSAEIMAQIRPMIEAFKKASRPKP